MNINSINEDKEQTHRKLASDTSKFVADGGKVTIGRTRKRKHEKRVAIVADPFRIPRLTAGQVVIDDSTQKPTAKRVRPPRKRFYVGLSIRHCGQRIMFSESFTPTEESHGHLFGAVIGPFRTKAGAIFMRDRGYNNPHCQTVAQAEKLAKLYK